MISCSPTRYFKITFYYCFFLKWSVLMSSLFPCFAPKDNLHLPPPPTPQDHRETPLGKSTALFSSTTGGSSWRRFTSPPLIIRRRTCSSPESAALSKTSALLKGLITALFSLRGVESDAVSDQQFHLEVISAEVQHLKNSKNISVFLFVFLSRHLIKKSANS